MSARPLVAAAALLAACASPHEATAPAGSSAAPASAALGAAPPSAIVPPAPRITMDVSLIDTLRELCRFVVKPSLTIDDVVQRLGPVAVDNGEGGSLELRSRDPRFSRVQVWRDASTGAPSLLDVELAPGVRVPVAEVRRALGPFTEVTGTGLGATPKALFRSVEKGASFVATVQARVEGKRGQLEEGVVSGFAILRDVRLE